MPTGTVATIDDTAFTAMLQQTTPQLRAFVRRLCGNDADCDDVLQEALAKAWRHRHSYKPQTNTQPGLAWLQRLAFRVFCDFRGQQRRQPKSEAAEAVDPVDAVPCQTELRDEVQHRLRKLPELERVLLVGFHRDDWSLRELAEHHNLPINTVKSHLHRARQRLHDARQLEGQQLDGQLLDGQQLDGPPRDGQRGASK